MSRKPANPKSYFTFPANLFAAINTTCSGNEAKVLLTLLGCKCDRPNTQYMLDMTGITQSNHYFAIRKKLEDKGYITINNGKIFINTDNILKKE